MEDGRSRIDETIELKKVIYYNILLYKEVRKTLYGLQLDLNSHARSPLLVSEHIA
jgi:hypothetical protein